LATSLSHTAAIPLGTPNRALSLRAVSSYSGRTVVHSGAESDSAVESSDCSGVIAGNWNTGAAESVDVVEEDVRAGPRVGCCDDGGEAGAAAKSGGAKVP
jgi:hypothetical protein